MFTQLILATGRLVIKKDIKADNGVIHLVDRVLFPPKGDALNRVKNIPAFSTLYAAFVKANQTHLLRGNVYESLKT